MFRKVRYTLSFERPFQNAGSQRQKHTLSQFIIYCLGRIDRLVWIFWWPWENIFKPVELFFEFLDLLKLKLRSWIDEYFIIYSFKSFFNWNLLSLKWHVLLFDFIALCAAFLIFLQILLLFFYAFNLSRTRFLLIKKRSLIELKFWHLIRSLHLVYQAFFLP